MKSIPPAPDSTRKKEFADALRVAEQEVAQAVLAVCATFPYTGSGLVGARAWKLGWRDTICEAAVCLCEVADDMELDPIDCAQTTTRNCLSHESIASDCGWLRVATQQLAPTGTNDNPPAAHRAWLARFCWRQCETFFAHPEHRAVIEAAGLSLTEPRLPIRHAPDDGAPQQDATAEIELLTRAGDHIPCFARQGHLLICDPSAIIPPAGWPGFCVTAAAASLEWTASRWAGVDMEIRSTGGDGLFYGVPVDTGLLVRLPLATAERSFKLNWTGMVQS